MGTSLLSLFFFKSLQEKERIYYRHLLLLLYSFFFIHTYIFFEGYYFFKNAFSSKLFNRKLSEVSLVCDEEEEDVEEEDVEDPAGF